MRSKPFIAAASGAGGRPAGCSGRAVWRPPGTCSVGVISMWPMFTATGAAMAKAIASAMSVGLRQLEARRRSARGSPGESPCTWAKMSVATRPGQISVTRTRLPKASMRSWRDSMLTAALVAW